MSFKSNLEKANSKASSTYICMAGRTSYIRIYICMCVLGMLAQIH